MAFCTSCGGAVSGAFCTKCGTPVSAAGGPPAAGRVPTPGMDAGAPPPQTRRTSPLVWVLIVVVGLFVLGGIATVGTGLFIAHKVRQAGFDPYMMRNNPGYGIARLFLAAHPDLVEVRHDDNAGSITVRDRQTGKESTLNFSDLKNGQFKITADSGNGETATMEFGGAAGKLPAWVPEYPGSNGKATFSVRGAGGQGEGEGGNFTFTTMDSPTQVTTFYQDKARDLGMKANVTTTTSEGGVFTAADEGSKRSLVVVIGRSGSETTVNVTYGLKR